MSTGAARSFQIDKLLETVVKERVSDLHITVGQPPVIRAGGRMVRLETRTLSADDTTNLMKSITPERNQQELQERGGTDFGFAFGDKARFRVAVNQRYARPEDGVASRDEVALIPPVSGG